MFVPNRPHRGNMQAVGCVIDQLQGIEHGSIDSRPTVFLVQRYLCVHLICFVCATLSLRSLRVFRAALYFAFNRCFCETLSLHPFICLDLFVKPEPDSILLTVSFVDGGLA